MYNDPAGQVPADFGSGSDERALVADTRRGESDETGNIVVADRSGVGQQLANNMLW